MQQSTRITVTMVLAGTLLLCASIACSAITIRIDVRSVGSGNPFDSAPRLTAGQTLVLELENVNTFRERYSLKVETLDFHNASSDALKNLVITSTPATGTVVPEAGGPVSAIAGGLPEPFRRAFRQYTKAFADFMALQVSPSDFDSDLGSQLAELTDSASTNVEIRRNVARALECTRLRCSFEEVLLTVEDYLGMNPNQPYATVQGDEKLMEYQVEVKSKLVNAIESATDCKQKELRDAFSNVNAAFQEWSRYYHAWRFAYKLAPDGGLSLSAVVDCVVGSMEDQLGKSADLDVLKRYLLGEVTGKGKCEQSKARDMSSSPETANDEEASNPLQNLDTTLSGLDGVAKQSLETADKIHTQRNAMLTAIAGNMHAAAQIVNVCFDPTITPGVIVREYGVGSKADQIKITVHVETVPNPISRPQQFDPKVGVGILVTNAPCTVVASSMTLPVYGRLVHDFSAGIAATSLRLRNYYAQNLGSTKVVAEGERNPADIDASVLFHLYVTRPWPVTPALTVGIATGNTFRTLFGASVLLGSQRCRVYLTYGLAYGKTNRLIGDQVGQPPNNGSTPNVNSSFEVAGTFEALTWSFSF